MVQTSIEVMIKMMMAMIDDDQDVSNDLYDGDDKGYL
jgi:hypothetical protein